MCVCMCLCVWQPLGAATGLMKLDRTLNLNCRMITELSLGNTPVENVAQAVKRGRELANAI